LKFGTIDYVSQLPSDPHTEIDGGRKGVWLEGIGEVDTSRMAYSFLFSF